ncbi:MAG: class I SAM-dependent methyltransferase [Sphingosinicella sp.]
MQRGRHLVRADRGLATGGDLFARLLARGFGRLLAGIDQGLASGRLDLTLPDGEFRSLGGRGAGPMARVELNSWRAVGRLGTSGSVGWYRAWAEGEWSSPDPVALFELFTRNAVTLGETARAKGPWKLINHVAHRLRANAPARARRNIEHHYDLGNDFYAAWLDESLTYSCAIFKEPIAADEPLETAQLRKLRQLLDRLQLKPGQRLLEIGCGWGSLAEIAARDYQVQVVGLTLSAQQKSFAEQRLACAGLGDRAEFWLSDYRDVDERFDAVASVEMVEAVGREYWPAYLQCIAHALPAGRRAALQLIAIAEPLFERYAANADFIQTYIFPGGLLISETIFRRVAEEAGLEWRDRRSYGAHYAETLRRWRLRYDAAVREQRLPPGFDQRFHDLWRYYLMYCEGGFRGDALDVLQVTLVKK